MQKSKKEEIKKLEEQLDAQKQETKSVKKELQKAARAVRQETRKQIVLALTAAFGFIIALVWRDAIKSYVDQVISKLSIQGPQSLILLYTAIITTILAVIGIIAMNKLNSKRASD